jgi:hypothetical protein
LPCTSDTRIAVPAFIVPGIFKMNASLAGLGNTVTECPELRAIASSFEDKV